MNTSTKVLIELRDVYLEVDEVRPRSEIENQTIFKSFYTRKTVISKMILSEISIKVCAGDRIALMGRNGAGKTTLLKLLAGIRTPKKGLAIYKNENHFLLGNHSLGFSNHATIAENIIINGLSKGIGISVLRDNLENILEFSEMTEMRNTETQALSSGQKMRVALAVSLYADADIYLIDEWIGALDSYFFKKFNKALIEKLTKSKSLVMASHNQQLLTKMCNKSIVIDDGKILYLGGLQEGFSIVNKLV